MHVFELTRALIDIDSVTPNEREAGEFFHGVLSGLASEFEGEVERIEVEPERYNVFARWGEPEIVLSTHMDTVPPFIPSGEDDEFIWGRGACDTKGISASMITALRSLLDAGVRGLGMLLVVGEETDGAGALKANENPPGSKFLINGEPTENKLALGSKGALRVDIEAQGKMAHSAYPELGESAIEKLLDSLDSLRRTEWPVDETLGESTCNIGMISGGRAPNVIPDEASAAVFIRVVSDIEELKELVRRRLNSQVSYDFSVQTPAVRLKAVPGFETCVVRYTTDIPKLTRWGEPLLIGPGSIHHAHTSEERVEKKQLLEAVELYQKLVRCLQDQKQ